MLTPKFPNGLAKLFRGESFQGVGVECWKQEVLGNHPVGQFLQHSASGVGGQRTGVPAGEQHPRLAFCNFSPNISIPERKPCRGLSGRWNDYLHSVRVSEQESEQLAYRQIV